jgi:hypothetical protein
MIEISLAIRTLVALVFLTAAWGKVRNFPAFRGVTANYRLLPDRLVAPFAFLLPPAEALAGISLPVAPASPWPEAAAAALLGLFALAMGINLLRGRRHIDCGCFQSASKQTLSWMLVARNGVLILALGAAARAPAGLPSRWGAAEGLLAGAVLLVLLQSLNILWSVVPAWRQPHAHHGGAGK